MAMTAPQIARSLMMCLLGLLLSGSTTLLAQSIDGTTFLPVQEQLPLGTEMVSVVDGQAEMDESFMPGLVEFARVGAALLGVVMLLLAMRYMLRRMGGGFSAKRPSGVVQIHARYPVSRGQQIVILQVGNRFIVAHQGGGDMRTLSEITDSDEVARLKQTLAGHGASSGGDFQQELAEAAAAASDGVVDLTRTPRPSGVHGNRPGRIRMPGWRGTS